MIRSGLADNPPETPLGLQRGYSATDPPEYGLMGKWMIGVSSRRFETFPRRGSAYTWIARFRPERC